jgi:hypothetical protein
MPSSGPTLSVSVPCLVRPVPGPTRGWAYVEFPGSFVAIYRILLNAFPLLFPADVSCHLNLRRLVGHSSFPSLPDSSAICVSPQPTVKPDSLPDKPPIELKQARLSSVAQAHQTWLRQRSPRWHSIVAGSVAGGVAISFEKLSRRKIIAQQLFVRRVIPFAYERGSLMLSAHHIAVSKVPITPIQRSVDSAYRTGMSSSLLCREY